MSNKIVTLKDKIGNVILPRTSVNSIIDKESLEIVGNKITSWSGTPSDDKYPSEKLVKITIENKADTSHIHGNISNGGKIGATGNLLVFTGTDGKLDTISTGSNGQVLKLSSGKPTWSNEYSYNLPTASSSTLGGVKIGSDISITGGVISISTTTSGEESKVVKTGTDGSITAKDKFNLGNKANIFFNSTTNTIDFAFA